MSAFELIGLALIVLIGFTAALALFAAVAASIANDIAGRDEQDDLGPFFEYEQTGGFRRR